MSKLLGFTLIEAMITVAVIGILAAIAYPSYQEYVASSSRSDAVALLLDAANRQEQYYLDHHGYTADMKKLGYAANPQKSENGYYNVSAKIDAAVGFKITATAIGVQAARDSKCTSLSINGTGTKYSNGDATDVSECWP